MLLPQLSTLQEIKCSCFDYSEEHNFCRLTCNPNTEILLIHNFGMDQCLQNLFQLGVVLPVDILWMLLVWTLSGQSKHSIGIVWTLCGHSAGIVWTKHNPATHKTCLH